MPVQKIKRLKCKCHPDGPFHWKWNTSPTVFVRDKYFTPIGAASGIGATKRVEESRAQGKEIGVIRGISRNREEEMLRLKTFTTFTKAK